MLFKFSSIFLIALLAASGNSNAHGSITGNELLNECTSGINIQDETANLTTTDYINSMACASYINAINDMHGLMIYIFSGFSEDNKELEKLGLYCLPDKMTTGQTVRIIVKYMKEHPEELHHPADMLIVKALKNTFPCKNKAIKK